MSAAGIYCADCGSECETVLGREAGLREPGAADAQVWACPVCPGAWAPCGPDGAPVGLPAGEETRNARAMLRKGQVERLVAEALRDAPNGRAIAEERIAAFLAHGIGLPLAEAAIDRLDILWCRKAWLALKSATYADVVRHAQTYRARKVA